MIPPVITRRSIADWGGAGVAHTIPQPPGQPSASSGQTNDEPAGHGGGVQTMVGVGVASGATAETEGPIMKMRARIEMSNRESIRCLYLHE